MVSYRLSRRSLDSLDVEGPSALSNGRTNMRTARIRFFSLALVGKGCWVLALQICWFDGVRFWVSDRWVHRGRDLSAIQG